MKGRIFTARKRSLNQGNVFTRVCHSLHGREGVCLQGVVCLHGGFAYMGSAFRGFCIRGGTDTPEINGMLQDTVNKRAVCILLECFLVRR